MSRKAKPLYLTAILDGARLQEQLTQLRKDQRAVEEAGLKKEAARRFNPLITEKLRQIRAKMAEAQRQRAALVREMLLCFAAGDVATTCADRMEQVFNELTFGKDGHGGKAMAQVFREQASAFNRCVQMIDGDGAGDERVSAYYADMAEEVVSAVIPAIYKIVDRYMESEEGQKLL